MDCNNAIDFIPDLDDWTQRLKETPYDPLEDIRQEHESWLAELEGLAVEALASGIWEPVYSHIASFPDAPDFDDGIADPIAMITEVTRLKAEASADSLSGSSADTLCRAFCLEEVDGNYTAIHSLNPVLKGLADVVPCHPDY